MDEPFARAACGTAGHLQVLASEIGVTSLYEADLRSATHRTLQVRLPDRVVVEQAPPPPSWRPRGSFDLGVLDNSGGRWKALAELKLWRSADKADEAVWDVWKLASAHADRHTDYAYAIAVGRTSDWETERPSIELLEGGSFAAPAAWEQFSALWRSWITANAGPLRLPGRITTWQVATVPIHVADGEEWLLRCAGVAAEGRETWNLPAA